jgi:ribosomal protein S14
LRESGSNRRVGKRREQKDAWEEAQRHPCAECGRPGVWRKHKLCADCYRRELREATDARRAEIQRRWLAGETHRQIALALGSTAPSIQVELVRMRQLGWDVPRRGARGKALA